MMELIFTFIIKLILIFTRLMRKVTSLELWHAAVKGKMHLQYTVPTKHTLIDNGYFLLLDAGI